AGLSLLAGFISEIPRFPVVHVRAAFIKNNSGIGPDAAGELLVQTGREHRPLAAVGMADDADALRVNLWQRRERVAAVRGNIREKRKWLARDLAGVRLAGVAAGRTDRERHETASSQLITEVTQPVRAQTDACLGLVIRHEHGGKRSFTLRLQQ